MFNLGTRTTTSVDRIATIVADEMDIDPEYEYTGGDRGWTGDVPRMRLSVDKLSALGWEPEQSSDDAVRQSTRELLEELRARFRPGTYRSVVLLPRRGRWPRRTRRLHGCRGAVKRRI